MDEIVPGLWIGDLPSALDTKTLKENGIFSILSAMRGRVTINETFTRHQILLDDTADEDILIHLLPSITFIQAELDKGRGVLVHCQAGMSRSATIVAAYLMYTQNIGVEQALEIIRKIRPDTQPNDGFLTQLEVFHQASFKITRSNKPTRMYYLARTVEEVMNGDGSLPDSASMFAKFPNTPTDSHPATPAPIVRRRIRCKMCRYVLTPSRGHPSNVFLS
jgi:dual specificity phosphatase 12